MTELQSRVIGVDFKNRKGLLLGFGIGLCVMGLMSAATVPMVLIGYVIAEFSPQVAEEANINIPQTIMAVVVYAFIAAWFIVMGIGSIKCRRWARSLILSSAWLWLAGGIFGVVFMVCFMPATQPNLGPQPQPQFTEQIIVMIRIISIAFMMFYYVIVPLALVIVYSGKNVRYTCEHWDEKIRWTDKCLTPVLTICVLLAVWALSLPGLAVQNWAFPFFGSVLDSGAGAAAISSAVIMALLAWRLYKLDIAAWWGTLILIAAWFSSFVITFSGDSIWEFYEAFNMPQEHLEIIKANNAYQPMMIVMMSIWGVGLVGYLVYIKRYFKKDSTQQHVLVQEQS